MEELATYCILLPSLINSSPPAKKTVVTLSRKLLRTSCSMLEY
jgi:hypothetical protein